MHDNRKNIIELHYKPIPASAGMGLFFTLEIAMM